MNQTPQAAQAEVGTDQVIKIMDLVIETGNVADKVTHEQGGIGAKIGHAMSLIDELSAIGSVKLSEVKAQLQNLSPQEKAELHAHFATKFDIANDALEAKIEQGAAIVIKAIDLVEEVIGFVKG